MTMRNVALGIALSVVATGAGSTVRASDSDEEQRVRAATTVLNEMMQASDQAIPVSVLEKAEAIAIFPSVKKAGFVFGGQWGRGIISVRDPKTRKWSSPAFLTLTGGSVGWQIGGEFSRQRGRAEDGADSLHPVDARGVAASAGDAATPAVLLNLHPTRTGDHMTRNTHDTTNGHDGQSLTFLKGLLSGALIGAAAGILLAPRAHAALHGLWGQVTDSAASLGKAATDRYRRASTQVGDAVQDLHDKGRGAYGKALTAVAAGAHQVEEYAVDAKTVLDRHAAEQSRRQSS